jgi:hypothetical protein
MTLLSEYRMSALRDGCDGHRFIVNVLGLAAT